jgi:ferredoxin
VTLPPSPPETSDTDRADYVDDDRGGGAHPVAMPVVRFAGAEVECDVGANLRRVLLEARLPLYNPPMKIIHCRGFGTCGTCAVKIEGDVSPMTSIERWRLGFRPHRADAGLRLACQCEVRGDLELTKFPGRWGQAVDEPPLHGPR